jgi:hypothetical protein
MVRIPVEVEANFRGLARKPGEFVNQAGELVTYEAQLNFEVDVDGLTSSVPVRVQDLDNASPPIDYKALQKNDMVTLGGHVALADKGSGKDSYFVVESLVREGSARAAKAA